jgi:hypothetical protein
MRRVLPHRIMARGRGPFAIIYKVKNVVIIVRCQSSVQSFAISFFCNFQYIESAN